MKIASNRGLYGKVQQHERDCQRCGQRFTTKKVRPYCWPCYRAKRAEQQAAYIGRVLSRAAGNRAGVGRAED